MPGIPGGNLAWLQGQAGACRVVASTVGVVVQAFVNRAHIAMLARLSVEIPNPPGYVSRIRGMLLVTHLPRSAISHEELCADANLRTGCFHRRRERRWTHADASSAKVGSNLASTYRHAPELKECLHVPLPLRVAAAAGRGGVTLPLLLFLFVFPPLICLFLRLLCTGSARSNASGLGVFILFETNLKRLRKRIQLWHHCPGLCLCWRPHRRPDSRPHAWPHGWPHWWPHHRLGQAPWNHSTDDCTFIVSCSHRCWTLTASLSPIRSLTFTVGLIDAQYNLRAAVLIYRS
mmetsp:Transcript_123245/g.226054  ORF Transcript_123245/g.226054 Transcript_123245/m.226054 type:complete len:290 (+) Transcript_123245:56-925(+)